MRTLAPSDFTSATPPLELDDDEIHLWIFPLHGSAGGKSGATHCLRETLAAYLGVDAGALRIGRNAAGKPHLIDAALQFNVSHSGEVLLIGLSRRQALGVDIESGARARPYLQIAQRYFTANEAAALARLPAARLADKFIELWSAKEAVLKAIGRGIAFGLDRVGFELDVEGATRRLVHLDAQAGTPEQWRLVRLSPHAGITGALGWRGPDMRLRAFVATDADAAATIRVSCTS